MDNIFESIAAATKPMEVSLSEDAKKLEEMHVKLMEVANSYQFSTVPGFDAQVDIKHGLKLLREAIQVKCKP